MHKIMIEFNEMTSSFLTVYFYFCLIAVTIGTDANVFIELLGLEDPKSKKGGQYMHVSRVTH